MSTISQRYDASKRHRLHWDGFPKPKGRDSSSPSLRTFLSASPPRMIPRTPSPPQDTAVNVEVSPLPSPLLGPRVDVDVDAAPAPGTKTNTFFGSSWKLAIPKPISPLPLYNKSSSTELQTRIPADLPKAPPEPTAYSQTHDFFNSPAKHRPSPPPSISPLTPTDDKPDSAALRLQLARLSPLSDQADAPRSPEDSETGTHSRSSSRSSAYALALPKPPREFIYWTPESTDLSRSSSRSSVSGVRRDLAFTPLDASVSYSPPNYGASRLRQMGDTPIISPIEVLPAKTDHMSPTTPTPHHYTPVRRETYRQSPTDNELAPGTIIGEDAPLCLVRLLGQGAFSSVWLARDVEDRLILPSPKQRRRKSVSTARRDGDVLSGLRPAPRATKGLGVLNEFDGEGAILPDILPEERVRVCRLPGEAGKLVAVKMLDRKLCETNDRTRISFVREVEVLRHISHPSIVAFLHSFTTMTHHCLVLEHVAGGELFELINSDENHLRMTTPLLRRMWGELCRAVGWLHGVAIVHRDIKLENILLVTNPFLSPDPIDVEALPQPLVKLTDFGLARFIDPIQPTLTTRCGSELYAAPELVTGSSYDGRQTDAWACGIVLYALAVRCLPFDPKPSENGRDSRRRYLVRIAKCEYTWPDAAVLATPDLRRVVERLLVRDPARRAKIVDLWDEEFMRGTGAPSPPWRIDARRKRAVANEIAAGEPAIMEEYEDEYEGGILVDAHDIDSIASQELV